jgi:hypothetical protein
MIDKYELLKHSNKFRDIRQLEKNYLLTLLLHEIYSVFAKELIFWGGTAIKLFHNLNRFSEDLDFSYTGLWEQEERHIFYEKMEICLDTLSAQYEVTRREHRGNKQNNETVGVNYEITVRGPLSTRLGHLENIKIDIGTRKDSILSPELKYLSPVYADITTFSVPVMNIEEILSEKIASVLERERMRDVYDLYYLLAIRGIRYDRDLVLRKMNLRNEVFDGDKLSHKLEMLSKKRWKSELDYLVSNLPSSTEVSSNLSKILC